MSTHRCAYCQAPIAPTNSKGRPRRCCSRRCKEADKSRRNRKPPAPDLLRFTQRDDARYRRAMLHDPCAYCGGRSTVIDHITPRIAGGPNGWENSTGSCTGCNGAKQSDSLLAHLLRASINRDIDRLKQTRTLLPGARGGQ